jgi:threonine/homoserine/homoserine lactone efflux protein
VTVAFDELVLYAGAVFLLFLIPGPVWAALIARALSGGFRSAWPLALGVVIGDGLWTVVAVLGVAWLASNFEGFLTVLTFSGATLLVLMGAQLIYRAGKVIQRDGRLTVSGAWSGFFAGAFISIGNPKAVLFYLGVLPGFFDLTEITTLDIAAIGSVSMLVPFLGNLVLAAFVHKSRALISSETGRRRINIASGLSLILVGIAIAVT